MFGIVKTVEKKVNIDLEKECSELREEVRKLKRQLEEKEEYNRNMHVMVNHLCYETTAYNILIRETSEHSGKSESEISVMVYKKDYEIRKRGV